MNEIEDIIEDKNNNCVLLSIKDKGKFLLFDRDNKKVTNLDWIINFLTSLKEKEFGDAEQLAKFMHEKYEDYAKQVGWNTQDSCKVDFFDLPQKNRMTMILVAGAILQKLDDGFDLPGSEEFGGRR